MWRLVFMSILSVIPTWVSAEAANDGKRCSEILAAPPFDDLLVGEGRDRINDLRTTRELDVKLFGVPCSRDELVAYFGTSGGTLDRELEGKFEHPRFVTDELYEFCIPSVILYIIPDPCGIWIQFQFGEGVIRKIIVGGGLGL